MTLSEDERRELADIERHLAEEDPRLVRRLRSGFVESLRVNLLCAAMMLLSSTGAPVLIAAGVVTHSVALMIVGGLMAASGTGAAIVWFSTRRGRKSEKER